MPWQNPHLIVNPTSGRGRAARGVEALLPRLSQVLPGLTVLHTQSRGHATELARKAQAAGAEILLVAGGDGTLHEVINGMLPNPATLAILPLGTGNDLARTLGITQQNAVSILCNGEARPIDLGLLEQGAASVAFANVAGVGFDAAVAERINQGYRQMRGTTAYIAAVLETLRTFRAVPLTVQVDGQTHEVEAMLCAVANAQSYGGGMRIAPDAKVDDGFLDVVILSKVSKFEFLRQFPKVFAGKHVSHPAVRVVRGTQIRIEAHGNPPVLVDGEIAAPPPVVISIRPRALPVLMAK